MSDQAKILIVDDSADIVQFLADFLQATGYAICTASSGRRPSNKSSASDPTSFCLM